MRFSLNDSIIIEECGIRRPINLKKIADKTIIITGATSGIGRALAIKLSKRQANLILISRSEAKLNQLHDELSTKSNSDIQVYAADLSNRGACQTVFEKVIRNCRQIDGLINNAGLGIFEYGHLTQTNDLDRMFQLNVYSIIESLKVMIPFFQTQKYGHIINIGSMAGKMATPKASVYSATKSALIAYTNAVRLEVETNDLLITTVNLGPVNTNFFKQADPTGDYQQSVSRYMLTADEVADKIIKNLFIRKREINLPWWMAIGAKIHYQFPTLVETMLKKQFNKK